MSGLPEIEDDRKSSQSQSSEVSRKTARMEIPEGGLITPKEQTGNQTPKRDRTPRSARTSLCSRPDSTNSYTHPVGNLVEQLQYKFAVQDESVQRLMERQTAMEEKANDMVVSLAGVLEQLQGNQQQTEQMTKIHTEAIQEMNQQSLLIIEQSRKSEEMVSVQQRLINEQKADGQTLVAQMQRMFADQTERLANQERETRTI